MKNKRKTRTGWIISILTSAMLLLDGVMKIIQPIEVIQATTELGYSANSISTIGVILIVCTILFLIPKTSVWGALLLTGYLGGAVATHFRMDNPLFSHQLFPVYLGVLVWIGISLRNPVIRQIFINPESHSNECITEN